MRATYALDFSFTDQILAYRYKGAFLTDVPFYAPQTAGTQYDWNYSTVPQTGLNNRVLAYPRGFILGGSSAISEY